MFDSRTASDGVLRAYAVVVVAASAKSVVPRRRMVCAVCKLVPPTFVRGSVVDFQRRSGYLIRMWRFDFGCWRGQLLSCLRLEIARSDTAETPLC